eukprot:1195706-Prorocentrum_minimum.AAC.4
MVSQLMSPSGTSTHNALWHERNDVHVRERARRKAVNGCVLFLTSFLPSFADIVGAYSPDDAADQTAVSL